jgi:MFS family permease
MAPMTPSTQSAARTTYRSVFAARPFRVLFTALLMYVLGFEFEILGLSVLVFVQTRSAFWTALAFSLGFAPQVVGGALVSSLADRLPPRTVIWTGLLGRAAPGLVIGLWPGLPVPAMLALVAAAATAAPVFTAAISGLLPDVLDGDRYVLGRSIFNLTGSGAQIIGLGIGGAVLAALPARWLLLAAGAALAVAAAVIRFGLQPVPRLRPPARGIIRTTVTGHVELLADRTVRGLLLAQWLPAWFSAAAESLIVPYTGSLGRPASAAGPLLAAVPAGMLVGEVLVGRFCPPGRRRRLAFPLVAGIGLPLLALFFRPALSLAAVFLLISGAGFAYQLGLQQAFLDSVPERRRGQAFGLNSTGAMGGQGLIPPAAGGLASVTGAGTAMAIAGAATILAALALRGPLTGRWRRANGLLGRGRGLDGQEVGHADEPEYLPLEGPDAAPALVVNQPRPDHADGAPAGAQLAAARSEHVLDPVRVRAVGQGEQEAVLGPEHVDRRLVPAT